MVKDIPKMGVLKGPSAKFSNPFCHIVESHGLIDGTKATTDVHHAICMILHMAGVLQKRRWELRVELDFNNKKNNSHKEYAVV